MRKQTLIIALKYGLGLGMLTLVICLNWHQEKDGVEVGLAAAMHRPIDWAAFAATMGICAISIAITILRWHVLVRAQQLPFTISSAFRLGLIGLYWNTFLPGSVGGDIIKAACITREQSRRTVAVATVLLDRVVGLCGLFWLVTLLGSFLNMATAEDGTPVADESQAALRYILMAATALSAASLVCWLVMGLFSELWAARMAGRLERTPKIGVSLAEFWRAVWLYRRRGRNVAIALVLAIVAHGGFVLSYYFAAQVLSPPPLPSLPAHFLIVPVGMTVQAGVPTPGGLGFGEIGFGALYALAGATFAAGALAGLVQRFAMWLLAFAGYLVYFRMQAAAPPTNSAPSG